jgi:hypothetical protein
MHMRSRMSRALLGAALAMSLATLSSAAQPPSGQAPGQARKYRATSAIVVDQQTGQRRFPTEREVDDLVATLSRLSAQVSRPVASSSGRSVALDSGYEGIILGRANEDGAVETRCVYSFDEGVAFLGLVTVEVQ